MRKIVIITTTFLVLSYARTAAAQLYTCTGQNNACTICDFFAMMVNVIGITLKFIVPSAIILAVVAAGVMMMLKQEDPDVWARAKKIMLTAIIGGLIAYGGWLLVSVSLMGLNSFNKDTWWKFELVCTHCGDGILQAGEECEPGLSEANCNEFCKIVVEKKPEIQDRCGTADGGKDLTDPGVSFDIVRAPQSPQGQMKVMSSGPHRGAYYYTCDEVCAARGQKCIGVGLTNPATNHCVSVVHHAGYMCELSGNLQQGSGCSDAYYSTFGGATCLELSSPCKSEWEPCGTYDGTVYYRTNGYDAIAIDTSGAVKGKSYVQFSVGETACYCQ